MKASELDGAISMLLQNPRNDLVYSQYLRKSLTEEQQLEVFMVCCERQSKLIEELSIIEFQEQLTFTGQMPIYSKEAKKIRKCLSVIDRLISFLDLADDHKLRGNIRFLKHFLESQGKSLSKE